MFSGTYTALVTPFNKDGSVDFGKVKDLIARQIDGGVAGIAPVGTTGESPTLDFPEHEHVIEAARGRIQVIAGTGANSTAEALMLTRHARDAGADATLQVTPYYNKPNQEGLYRHFSEVADLGLPVVLYNVPSRTGREISVETVARLSRHPKVLAIKEAGGSVDRVSEILTQCSITVLSGDDSLTLPMMAVGAKGVISVASNLVPRAVSDMTRYALEGHLAEARAMHLRLYPLFRDLFMDANPIPVKAAMAMAGLIEEVYRLPMCAMSDKLREQLRQTLKSIGIL